MSDEARLAAGQQQVMWDMRRTGVAIPGRSGDEADFIYAMWAVCNSTGTTRGQLIAIAQSTANLTAWQAQTFVDSTVANTCPGKRFTR